MTNEAAAIKLAERDNLVGELVEALESVIGWFPGPSAWHTDAPIKAVERARAVLAKAREEAKS